MGKLMFSFSPHGSAVVVNASDAMFVPEDIHSEDAVFLPSMVRAI
jgi:hypothetical protein